MRTEADTVYREKLVALMAALNGGEARDPGVRRVIGSVAHQLTKQIGAKSWTELKSTIDADAYSQLIRMFQEEGRKAATAGDHKTVRGIEALALSLVGREQQQSQPEVRPGLGFLDRFIEDCASKVRPPSRVVHTPPRARH